MEPPRIGRSDCCIFCPFFYWSSKIFKKCGNSSVEEEARDFPFKTEWLISLRPWKCSQARVIQNSSGRDQAHKLSCDGRVVSAVSLNNLILQIHLCFDLSWWHLGFLTQVFYSQKQFNTCFLRSSKTAKNKNNLNLHNHCIPCLQRFNFLKYSK